MERVNELRKLIIKTYATCSYQDISFNSQKYFLDSLRKISNDYGEEEVAKICFEVDRSIDSIRLLAISGNKETEPYIKLILDENKEDGDVIFDCAVGLIALNIDEGFEIMEEFIDGTHPFYDDAGADQSDIYYYLEHIDNPRANKIKFDIGRWKYQPVFKDKKKEILSLFELNGYDINIHPDEINFDYKININNEEKDFILYIDKGFPIKDNIEVLFKVFGQGKNLILSFEKERFSYESYLSKLENYPEVSKNLDNIIIVKDNKIYEPIKLEKLE